MHHRHRLPMQSLDKWVCTRGKAICREIRRLLVYEICMWSVAGAIFAHFHSMLAICDSMSRNGSCPQRDDWKSVALPLQSYRSTAAGVSSSAPPSLLSSRLLLSPPFVPHRKVTCCHLLAALRITSFTNEFAHISHLAVSLTCFFALLLT